jgi:hypothetical protein
MTPVFLNTSHSKERLGADAGADTAADDIADDGASAMPGWWRDCVRSLLMVLRMMVLCAV